MRIAYVCADRGIPTDGTKGASIHVRAVIRTLARRGHEMRLLAARTDSSSAAYGVGTTDIGFDRLLKQVRNRIEDEGDLSGLAKETYGLLLNTRLRQTLADLDANRRVDAIYERYSLWSWSALQFARERGIPYLLEVNAPLVHEQERYRGLSLRPVARALEGVLLREADAVIVPSSELRHHVWHAARKRRKVHVVPNGADLDLFDTPPVPPPAEFANLLRDRYVIAFLGTLKPWHGVRALLGAFRRVRETIDSAHLLVIGDGPMADRVEEARRRLGREAVTWTGPVPHERVPGWLSLAHVGVAPYPFIDGFYFCPLKIVEYLAAGLAVVASDIGEIPRLVQDGRTGLLVKPGSEGDLAKALVRLGRDPERRLRMAGRARDRARRRHGWERAGEAIEAILVELSNRRGSTSRRPREAVAGG